MTIDDLLYVSIHSRFPIPDFRFQFPDFIMSHDHHHHAEGNLKVVFFLNLAFTILEIVGGFYTSSLAILSDALHDLGDSLSLGLSWYFERLSKKGRTETFSYGYKRFSLLGAVTNAVILLVGSIIILTQAIPQLFSPEETDAKGMLYLATLGVVVNGAAVFRLRKGESINERVVSLHLLEDILGWLAVLVGSVIMLYFDAPFVDPLLSIFIASFVIYNVFKNLRKSLLIILQGTPENVDVDTLREKLNSIDEVTDIHDCHTWSMDGRYNVLTTHIVLNKDYALSEQFEIKKRIQELLKNQSINHVTVEFEGPDEQCDLKDC